MAVWIRRLSRAGARFRGRPRRKRTSAASCASGAFSG